MLSFVCSSLCTDQLWPHCMHNIDHRYSALLQTKWHGLCVCVCVFVTTVSRAKTDEPIKKPFGGRLMWAKGTMYYVSDGSAHWHYVANTMDRSVRR